MRKALRALVLVPVVVTMGLAFAAEGAPRAEVFGVSEGRDAANARPVLIVQGKRLNLLRFFTLAPADGEGASVFPAVLASGSGGLVLGLPGDTEPGSYTLTMADRQGRMMEIPVQIGNGEPIPGTVRARSLDATLRADLDDAATLEGQPAAFYRDASNLNAGTVPLDRFSAYANLLAEGKVGAGASQLAAGDHLHDARYALLGHGHPEYLTSVDAAATYAPLNHNHDATYAKKALIGAKVYRSATFTLVSPAYTAIPWNAEEFDTSAIHDTTTDPERLTCPSAGYYTVGARLIFQQSLYGNALRIRKNGTPVLYLNSNGPALTGSGGPDEHVGATLLYLAQGDYLDIEARIGSGTADLRTGAAEAQFWMYQVGE